jgi:hypothetical protein
MCRILQRSFLLLVALLAIAPAWAQRGALTIANNLRQLTSRADVIVRGSVIEARVEKHPELTNLDTIVVTLRVSDTLKGIAAKTYTFRQYIWDIRDRKDVAGYRKGQEYLLLMNAPSRYGLTSPAGLEQGRFRIARNASGKEMALNGRGNVGLFEGVGADLAKQGATLSPMSAALVAKHRKGPIAERDLAALIRELVRQGG